MRDAIPASRGLGDLIACWIKEKSLEEGGNSDTGRGLDAEGYRSTVPAQPEAEEMISLADGFVIPQRRKYRYIIDAVSSDMRLVAN